jgi:ABC-type lipoprotein release transport system permease subunit
VNLVVGEACRLGVVGSVVGSAVAAVFGQLATHTVYISPDQASSLTPEKLNPAVFVMCSIFLVVLAMVASYAPARGVVESDPLIALRDE